MAFPVDDIVLGPASHGRLHRLDAIFGHTGEEPGFTRDYAVATAIWQRTNPGSYSFRVYDAASAGSKGGVMLNVPYLEASGGINPASSAWAPERFPWIERELAKAGPCPVRGCAGPYRNPTMHAGQISFVGRRDQLDAGKAPANYLPDARRLIAWYETHPLRGPAPLVIVMHGHLQTNRSDWGTWMQSRLAPQEDDVNVDTIIPIVNRRLKIRARATARTTPAFDPKAPTANAITVHETDITRIGIAYVTGTPLPGNPDATWVLTDRWQRDGGVFYHRQDVIGSEPIESSGLTQKQLDAAERAGILNGGQIATAAFARGGTDAAKAAITKAAGG